MESKPSHRNNDLFWPSTSTRNDGKATNPDQFDGSGYQNRAKWKSDH